jgi:HEAT repeat protein
MDDQERVAQGRSLRGRARAFAQHLRDKLRGRDAEDRLRALRIVRVLTMAADFQDRICALSHDEERKVRSLAVAMLSQLEGATAARILRQALNDPDDRVQANAVEAVAELSGGSEIESLARKLEADHQRVRANAVKALLAHRHRQAAVVLIGMLQHGSAAHRMSALWVVEQLGLATLAPRVRHLAQNDPDARVRERAWQVLSETLATSPVLPVASAERSTIP